MHTQPADHHVDVLWQPLTISPEKVQVSDSRIYQLFVLTNFVAATAVGVYYAPITFTAVVLMTSISWYCHFREKDSLSIRFCQQNLKSAQTAPLQKFRLLQIESVNQAVERLKCVKIEMANLALLWIGPFFCYYLPTTEPLFLIMRPFFCVFPGLAFGSVMTEQINRIRALNACRAIQAQISTLPILPQ